MEQEVFILAVYLNPDICGLAGVFLTNTRVNVAEQLDTGEPNRRNELVKLAIWILSIVTNSAGSERGLSEFGLFLTKLRSQLCIQKVRKMTTTDMGLKNQHEEIGLTTDLIKHKFDHFTVGPGILPVYKASFYSDNTEQYEGEGDGAQAMDYDEEDSFSLATQLRNDLTNTRKNFTN
ncbi:hypothetical protein B0H17DRAFT_1145650 [Mycena rosella]|uniref:Uncharacterized protein n=1 Tax=Mycena rosella TaxID=1033263 RepID=A0AAD7G5P1_MYCRO|nr:hypothetical protein B0H17DRAFT_1145650 [Mycena rosella]